MNNKYTPGQDCGCHAYYEGECGFGADRVPSEVYELREKLTAERALSDRLHGALDALDYNLAFAENTAHGSLGEKITAMRAIALPAIEAWKEARND